MTITTHCRVCNGKGYTWEPNDTKPHLLQRETCWNCKGSGIVVYPKHREPHN